MEREKLTTLLSSFQRTHRSNPEPSSRINDHINGFSSKATTSPRSLTLEITLAAPAPFGRRKAQHWSSAVAGSRVKRRAIDVLI
jgi:hypothetical protein